MIWTRRRWLRATLSSAIAMPFANAWGQEPAAAVGAEKGSETSEFPWLELTNTHTGEVAKATFRDAKGYVDDALKKFQRVLRDHRRDEEHEMDPALFDQLSDLAIAAKREPRYEIISGYRAPATNALLHSKSKGVSERSLHMQGRATDVRLKGLSCADLRDLALAARRGGVGYYEKSNFVHIDTGRVRTWVG